MASAQMSIEEQKVDAPVFEPAVADAAAAAPAPGVLDPTRQRKKLLVPIMRPATAEEALTPEELRSYKELLAEIEKAKIPDWLTVNSLQAANINKTIDNARAEGYTPRENSGPESIKRSVIARYRERVALLSRRNAFDFKIAKARRVPVGKK
jgi:hypothetical protein